MRSQLVVTGLDSMHSKTITSPSDSIKKLSVLIHQDGLSFYIYEPSGVVETVSVDFKHSANPVEILQSIEKCFEEEAVLSYAFAKATLIYHHNIFTCVPAAIFKEENAVDYLKYNARILETDIISIDDQLGTLGANTVYIAYENINNYFFDRYGSYEYYHYSSRILQYHSTQLVTTASQVFLDIKKNHFYLTIINNGRLIAHNLYPHDAIEDILYYTLFTTHHNELDPETMEVVIYDEDKNESLHDLLYTYVRHVKFNTNHSNYIKKLLCV